MVMGIQANDNNRAETVFLLFLNAINTHHTPSRAYGDHGVENLEVAHYIEEHYGTERGPYIWGRQVLQFIFFFSFLVADSSNRSVHHVQTECLWQDATQGFGLRWYNFFHNLEMVGGLDPDINAHIWLLHFLCLSSIDRDAMEWAESWNHHTM
jgi:hypothetical protein